MLCIIWKHYFKICASFSDSFLPSVSISIHGELADSHYLAIFVLVIKDWSGWYYAAAYLFYNNQGVARILFLSKNKEKNKKNDLGGIWTHIFALDWLNLKGNWTNTPRYTQICRIFVVGTPKGEGEDSEEPDACSTIELPNLVVISHFETNYTRCSNLKTWNHNYLHFLHNHHK